MIFYIYIISVFKKERQNGKVRMATVRRVGTRRNNVFDIDSVIFEINPDIDQDDLARYQAARDRNARHAAMGFLFAGILVQIRLWIEDNTNPQDHVQISMFSRDLQREIKTPLSRADAVSYQGFFGQIQNVLNSNENFDFENGLIFQVERVPFVGGGGRKCVADKMRKRCFNTLDEFTKLNLSVQVPPMTLAPGVCGPAALLMAVSYGQGHRIRPQRRFNTARKIIDFNEQCFFLMENAFIRNARYLSPGSRLSIEQMKQLIENNEGMFGEYAITIFDFNQGGSEVIFKINDMAVKQINLGLVLDHFVFVKSIPAYMGKGTGFYCSACEQVIEAKERHICRRAVCSQCKCIAQCHGQPKKCAQCKRVFKSQQCYENHLSGTSPMYEDVCKEIRACDYCFTDLKAKKGELVCDKEGYFRDAYKLGTAARHICFSRKCFTCGMKYDRLIENHKCYVKRLTPREKDELKENRLTIRNYYVDLETRVDKDENGNDVFVTNLAIIKKYEEDIITMIPLETERVTHIFKGDDAIRQLGDFLFFGTESLVARKVKANVFAHNGGRFDWHPILADFVKRCKNLSPKLIIAGSTIKQMRVGTVTLLDSRMFIAAPLANFSKMFDVKVKKGWFPHDFNRKENEEYEGPIPDVGYFDKTLQKKQEFKDWHAKLRREGYVWNFWAEIIAYCDDDVDLLMFGMEKFSTLVFDLTGCFPGGNNCSLASLANQVWRHKFFPEKKENKSLDIGIAPELGYPMDTQSKIAIQWLVYMSMYFYECKLQYSGSSVAGEKKIFVQREVPLPEIAGRSEDKFHTPESEKNKKKMAKDTEEIAKNAGVSTWLASRHALAKSFRRGRAGYGFKMQTFKVDGFHPDSNTVLEFYGCLYHGCPKCHDPDCKSPVGNETMRELYTKTMDREELLRKEGFEVVSMWECEWRSLVDGSHADQKEVWEVQSSLDELGIRSSDFETNPITPRLCLFGGRVNNAKMLHECTKLGEQICYVDVTSLYPFVMRNRFYPMGHPTIRRHGLSNELDKYFGVAKCILLPPKDLFHPVLPVKIEDESGNEKLIFPLCSKCASDRNFKIDSCQHTDEERQIEGCWITPEIYLAMRMGYKVVKWIEVWDYPFKSKECFREYIDTFFKLKAQAKGYPPGVITEEQKDAYIQKFFDETGIWLDKDKIKKDASMYQLAKLFLNTLWGYFCKNPHAQQQSNVVTDPAAFRRWLNDAALTNKNFCVLDENALLTVHKVIREFKKADCKGSIVHGGFTTGWARIHLYEKCLLPKGKDVLYFDTDSVIFKREREQPGLPLGDKLGELTDELEPVEKDGVMRDVYCAAFVSGGPKNYAMLICLKNLDGSIPRYEEKEIHTTKTVIRGFSLSEESKKVLNFEVMAKIVIDSAIWANADESERDEMVSNNAELREWFEEGGKVSESGLVNCSPPVVERFSVAIGDRQPVRGVNKRKVDETEETEINDDNLKRAANKRFRIAPVILKRKYSMIVSKRAPQFAEGDDQFVCYPFGYKKTKC